MSKIPIPPTRFASNARSAQASTQGLRGPAILHAHAVIQPAMSFDFGGGGGGKKPPPNFGRPRSKEEKANLVKAKQKSITVNCLHYAASKLAASIGESASAQVRALGTDGWGQWSMGIIDAVSRTENPGTWTFLGAAVRYTPCTNSALIPKPAIVVGVYHNPLDSALPRSEFDRQNAHYFFRATDGTYTGMASLDDHTSRAVTVAGSTFTQDSNHGPRTGDIRGYFVLL